MSKRSFHGQGSIPINLAGAVVVCDGNSLTYGQGASNPATTSYPAVLDGLTGFGTATIYNLGISAQETQDMIDDAAAQVDPLFNGSVKNILVAWEVGNDIYYNGSVANSITRFWQYCDARRAAGFIVVVVNCPPRDNSTPAGDNPTQYNIKLSQANAALAAEYKSHASALVDLAADSRFVGYNLTYYDADKIHYTDAGYAAVAELVAAKIKSLQNGL